MLLLSKKKSVHALTIQNVDLPDVLKIKPWCKNIKKDISLDFELQISFNIKIRKGYEEVIANS